MTHHSFRLSVLDQAPISKGSTGAEALHNSINLAHLAESLGYHRYWVAEHQASARRSGARLQLRKPARAPLRAAGESALLAYRVGVLGVAAGTWPAIAAMRGEFSPGPFTSPY